MSKLHQVLETHWDHFMSKVSRYDALGSHSGEKGQRRENALAEVLREFLPQKYGVASGEILTATDQVSKQMDIIIYDCLHSPTLADASDSKVIPAEAVYAVIEVKPNLKSARDMQAALDNIASAKSLSRTAVVASHGGHRQHHGPKGNSPLLGAIFTYGDHWSTERLGDEMLSRCDKQPQMEWPDVICAGTEGVVMWADKASTTSVQLCDPHDTPKESLALFRPFEGKASLGLFMTHLLYKISNMELFPPDLFAYLGMRAEK
jgi:hypothetical protein